MPFDKRITLEAPVVPEKLCDAVKRHEASFHGSVAKKRLERFLDPITYPDYAAQDRLRIAFFQGCVRSLQRTRRALDVGTGTGTWAVRLARCADRAVGIDLWEEMLSAARSYAGSLGLQNIGFLRMDAEDMRFPDSSFEVATHFSVLMHLPNPQTALEEAYRVLTPGGHLLLETWNAEWVIYRWFLRRRHARGRSPHMRYRFMTYKEVERILFSCGFHVACVSFACLVTDTMASRLCDVARSVRGLTFLLRLAPQYFAFSSWLGRRLGRYQRLGFLFREFHVLAQKPA